MTLIGGVLVAIKHRLVGPSSEVATIIDDLNNLALRAQNEADKAERELRLREVRRRK